MRLRRSLTFLLVVLCLMGVLSHALGAGSSTYENAKDAYEEGRVFFLKGNFSAAVEAFEQAVYLDPDYFLLLTGSGIMETFLRQGEQNVLKTIIKMCQNNMIKRHEKDSFFIWFYLGWAHLKQGNPHKASRHLRTAIEKMKSEEVDSDMAEALLRKAEERASS